MPRHSRSMDGNVTVDLEANQGLACLDLTHINVLNSTWPAPGPPRRAIRRPSYRRARGHADGQPLRGADRFEGASRNVLFTTDLAYQWNEDVDLEALAGRVQAGSTFAEARGTPILIYRYQTFSRDDPETAGLEQVDPLYYNGSHSAWATGSKSAMIRINLNVQSRNPSLAMCPAHRDTITLRHAHVRANELGSPLQFGQATRLDLTGATGNVVTGVTDAHLSDNVFIEYQRVINRNASLYANCTDGMLLLRRGRIVCEGYLGCLDEAGQHAAMSMTKSFTATQAEMTAFPGPERPRAWRPRVSLAARSRGCFRHGAPRSCVLARTGARRNRDRLRGSEGTKCNRGPSRRLRTCRT